MILKNQNLAKLSFAMVWICAWSAIQAQNPFVTDIYTADPTARVFDGKLYVYPSHDVDTCQENEGDNGFCMPDYHVHPIVLRKMAPIIFIFRESLQTKIYLEE